MIWVSTILTEGKSWNSKRRRQGEITPLYFLRRLGNSQIKNLQKALFASIPKEYGIKKKRLQTISQHFIFVLNLSAKVTILKFIRKLF